MKKEYFQFSNGKNALMEIDEGLLNLAIEKGWESLYFSENEDTFAIVTSGSLSICIYTHGEVRVDDLTTNELILGCDQDRIRKLCDSKDIYDVEKYIIDNNNWFSIDLYKKDEKGNLNFEQDWVFESEPTSLDEFKDLLKDIAESEFEGRY